MKPIAIGALAVAAGSIIWAGFAINHEMECRGLHEDVLNAASSMKQAVAIRALGKKGDALTKSADQLDKMNEARLKSAAEELTLKCGLRDAQTALREASEGLGL